MGAAREAAADAARQAEWERGEAAALRGTVRDLEAQLHAVEQGGAQARARATAGCQQGWKTAGMELGQACMRMSACLCLCEAGHVMARVGAAGSHQGHGCACI